MYHMHDVILTDISENVISPLIALIIGLGRTMLAVNKSMCRLSEIATDVYTNIKRADVDI